MKILMTTIAIFIFCSSYSQEIGEQKMKNATINIQSCPQADSLLQVSKRYEKKASRIMLGTVGMGIAGTVTCSFTEAHTVGYVCIGASFTSLAFVLYNTIKGAKTHNKAIEVSENDCRLSIIGEPDRVGLAFSF